MKRVLKLIGIVLGVMVGLVILAVGSVYIISNNRFNQNDDIEVEDLAVPSDQASIEYG